MQKTHGFLTSLRYRLSRGRSRERLNRKSPTDFPGNESTDYAADYSSENSSSVTPGQTPKHRSSTMSSSDTTKKEALTPSTDTYGNEFDSGNMNIPQGAIDLLHVNILCNEISLKNLSNVFCFTYRRKNYKESAKLAWGNTYSSSFAFTFEKASTW